MKNKQILILPLIAIFISILTFLPQNVHAITSYDLEVATTTTTVSSTVNPSVLLRPITFTATVSPSNATGTIQFQIDGSNFGTSVVLSGGSATSATTSSLTLGSHNITAIYGGDTTHHSSNGILTEIINLRSDSTTITPNPSSVTIGNKITFLAKLADNSLGTKSSPTGTVSWDDSGSGGSFNATSCTLTSTSSSTSSCKIVYSPPSHSGTITINGIYSGDSLHRINSGKSTLTVNLRTTTTTITPNPSSVTIGNKITFTGKVVDTNTGTKTVPTGTLTWSDGGMGGKFTVNGINTNICNLSSISSAASSCKTVYTPTSNVTAGITITIAASYSADATHKTSSGSSALDILITIKVGNSPTGIGVNTQTNKIYVANENDNTVSVIDLNTNNVIKTIPVGARPLDVEVNIQTNKIYVANYNSNNVTVINGSTDNVLTTIPVDTLPVGLAVNELTNKIYLGHANSNIVSVINGSTNTVIDTIHVGSSPEFVGVNPNTNIIYAANELSNNVSVINGNTNAVIATISVGGNPEFVKVDPALNQIYVANSLSGTVSVISGATNTVIATLHVGNLDAALGVNTVTHKVYVTNQGAHSVSVIDGTTNKVIATIPTSLAGPDYLGVNSATNKVYIADILSNIVVILNGL